MKSNIKDPFCHHLSPISFPSTFLVWLCCLSGAILIGPDISRYWASGVLSGRLPSWAQLLHMLALICHSLHLAPSSVPSSAQLLTPMNSMNSLFSLLFCIIVGFSFFFCCCCHLSEILGGCYLLYFWGSPYSFIKLPMASECAKDGLIQYLPTAFMQILSHSGHTSHSVQLEKNQCKFI